MFTIQNHKTAIVSIAILSVSLFSYCLASEPYTDVSAGISLSKLHLGNSTMMVTDTEEDSVHQTNNSPLFGFNIGIGYTVPLHTQTKYSIQWLPAIRAAFNFRYSFYNILGQIAQYQDPDMNNYNFNLNIQNIRFMYDMYFTLISIHNVSFYILGGIGNGISRVSYKDQPIPGVTDGGVSLNNRTNSNFVSEEGLGFSYPLSDRVNMSLEYLYANLGRIKTASHGTLDGIPAIITPAAFSLRSQTVLFNLSYKMS